ncbi:MAG: PilN domain-containing protein [Gemmatimonadaceae bacterium]
MIEINLLPNARKKSRATSSAKFDFGAAMGGLTERFKDPWLGVAVGGAVVGVLAIGLLWTLQGRTASELEARELVAVQDSARFAAIVAQRKSAEAQRDSITRQIAIITALDSDRFVWSHVMDEISKALPTYTWLTSVAQASPTASVSADAAEAPASPALSVRVIGITVDVQALTIFMTQLEASPFLERVTLAVSEVAIAEGKQVTEFTLDMAYSKPDKSEIRTVPLTVSVR